MSCYDPSYYDSPLLSVRNNSDNSITEDDFVFTAEEEAKYRRRQEEGYDIVTDTRFNAWLRSQHTLTSQKQLDTIAASGHQTCYDPSYYDSPLSPERNNDDNSITEDDFVFTAEEEAKYRRRQGEGYDIDTDTRYNTWLRLQHIFTSPKQLDTNKAQPVNLLKRTGTSTKILDKQISSVKITEIKRKEQNKMERERKRDEKNKEKKEQHQRKIEAQLKRIQEQQEKINKQKEKIEHEQKLLLQG